MYNLKSETMKQIILIASFILTAITTTYAQSDLTLTITGIRNAKGTVRIAVFNNAKGFPSENEKAFKTFSVKSSSGNITTTIKDLPFGNYAIIAFHDENDNNKFDTNFIGLPIEGNGTSNSTGKGMSKPKYENAVFSFSEKTKAVSVRIFY